MKDRRMKHSSITHAASLTDWPNRWWTASSAATGLFTEHKLSCHRLSHPAFKEKER